MNNLQFERAHMGLSLAFHIVFAAVGNAMPVMMAIAEGLHLRNRNPVFSLLLPLCYLLDPPRPSVQSIPPRLRIPLRLRVPRVLALKSPLGSLC
jgi:hypothetical protein